MVEILRWPRRVRSSGPDWQHLEPTTGCIEIITRLRSATPVRSLKVHWYWVTISRVSTSDYGPSVWELPLKWRKPRRIFLVNSMSDLLHRTFPTNLYIEINDVMRLSCHLARLPDIEAEESTTRSLWSNLCRGSRTSAVIVRSCVDRVKAILVHPGRGHG